MARFSLHTVGKDQPGIVARVTVALADLGANLEESNMTILHGQSSIMLIVEVPDINDGRVVEQTLENVAEEFNLFVTVVPLPADPPPFPQGDSYLVAIDGADQPGIVAGVASTIAAIGANVIDLTSRPMEREGSIDYVLRLSMVLPAGVAFSTLEAALIEVSQRLSMNYTIRPWNGELAWDSVN